MKEMLYKHGNTPPVDLKDRRMAAHHMNYSSIAGAVHTWTITDPTIVRRQSLKQGTKCQTSTTRMFETLAGIPAFLTYFCVSAVREDASPITKNTSRFLPHAIIG
jgi:hypothetical protein